MRNGGTRRQKLSGRIQMGSGLILTSMIDILTVLLLFVLKSFVSGGEQSVPPPGVTLPNSTADRPAVSSLVVAIDHDAILVGGEKVISVAEVAAATDPLIRPLAERLEQARAQMDDLARRHTEKQETARLVTIQGDRQVEFRVLQRVMYTVNQSGFPDIALAVLKKA
jgi:biopolymer transport protein ExbD